MKLDLLSVPGKVLWKADDFNPTPRAAVPNVEMHNYARGGHGSQKRDPDEIPYASRPDRLDAWLADLGFLVETR